MTDIEEQTQPWTITWSIEQRKEFLEDMPEKARGGHILVEDGDLQEYIIFSVLSFMLFLGITIGMT